MNDLMLLNSNVELDLLSEMELLNVFGGNGEGCVTNNGCNIYCPSAGAPACSGGSPCGGSKTDTTISGNTVYVFANCKGH